MKKLGYVEQGAFPCQPLTVGCFPKPTTYPGQSIVNPWDTPPQAPKKPLWPFDETPETPARLAVNALCEMSGYLQTVVMDRYPDGMGHIHRQHILATIEVMRGQLDRIKNEVLREE